MFPRAFFCLRRGASRIIAVSVVLVAFSVASDSRAGTDPGIVARLERHTLDVAASAAGPSLDRVAAAAAARRELFHQLVRENPAEALRLAIPARFRDRMPEAVRAHVEARRELSGTLAVRYVHAGLKTRLAYELDTGSRRFEVYFAASPPAVPSGTRVRVRGIVIEDAMAVASGDADVYTLDLDTQGSAAGSATPDSVAPLSGTLGEQRVLVLLVNWQDEPANQPYSLAEAYELVFGDVSDFLLENSFQQTWLNGEVHGWFTLPLDRPTDNNTTCKQTIVASEAKQAAQAAGIDLAAFDRYVYVFPQTSCFPSGTGTVGGTPSEAWINGSYFRLKTVAHEIGHNLGLSHAGALECGSVSVGADCQTFPYGDTMDTMGNNEAGHYNAFMKERLGWLDTQTATIAEARGSGIYRLEPYATPHVQAPKALKVLRETNPDTGEPTWFYLEYRQADGFDGFLSGNTNILNGVVVRIATESMLRRSVGSRLLDMTPGSYEVNDWRDPALPVGASFTDPGSGLSIFAEAGDGQSATVRVEAGTPGCSPSDPQLSVAPAASQWTAAGTQASHVILLTNTDSTGCAMESFDVAAAVPGGWMVEIDATGLMIPPGGTEDAVLMIASPSDAPDGVYDVEVVAGRTGGDGAGASATVTYVISSGNGNAAPVAVDDSAETTQGVSVSIDVLANDYDPDGDPLTVTAVGQPEYGSATVASDGQIEYRPRGKTRGLDRFTYTISDGLAEATAEVHVFVAAKSTGGSGGGGKGNGKDR